MMRITGVEISSKQNVQKNCNFEKFEITVNRIYSVRATSEMMIETMFAMVSMMHITRVEISKK